MSIGNLHHLVSNRSMLVALRGGGGINSSLNNPPVLLRSSPHHRLTPPALLRPLTTRESGAILEEPRRESRFGLVKVLATVAAGLGVGAWISRRFAAFLEENELFVPEDDDDDDDD